MTPPTLISVFNRSKRIGDDDVAAMVRAVGKQLARDAAPLYGIMPALEFVPHGATPTPGGAICEIIDAPDADGVLGYHDEDGSGVARIKVFVDPTLDNGGTATTGPNAVSVTLSHEVLELVGDAPANKWVDGPGGVDFAFELCDPVEGDVYEIDGVSVSNFVLQAYFDPRAEHGSRLDFLGKLRRPFTMTPGGYLITRSEPGKVSQVFAASHGHEIPLGHEAAPGVHVHFGAEVPDWKRSAKVAKAAAKRSARS